MLSIVAIMQWRNKLNAVAYMVNYQHIFMLSVAVNMAVLLLVTLNFKIFRCPVLSAVCIFQVILDLEGE